MVETDIIAYLNEKLGVDAYAERPEKTPDQFIIVQKTAGGMTNLIEHPTVAIQCYAKSLLEAAELNERVKGAMLYANAMSRIGRCRLNSDYNFTDTATKEYRYQAVYNLTYK